MLTSALKGDMITSCSFVSWANPEYERGKASQEDCWYFRTANQVTKSHSKVRGR